MEFVTAAANLRAACYGIPMQSLFETKASRLSLMLSCRHQPRWSRLLLLQCTPQCLI